MRRASWIMALMAAAVLAIGSGAAAEQGVTDTEIHIGQWGPQTGPAAPWGAVARGTDAYFKMINDQGGINGRKLIHHYFDDAYNPAKTVAGVKQLQEEKGMFAWVSGVGTSCGLAVKDYILERKIPWVGPSAGSTHWIDPPNKYLFNVYPMYAGDAQILVRHAAQTLKMKKLAVIFVNDDYGKYGLAGAKKQLLKEGMTLVAEVPVNVTDTDLKPHTMELKKAEPEAVLMFVTPGQVARLLGTAKAMQFAPKFMTTTTCADIPLMMAITQGGFGGTIAASFGLMDPTKVGIGNIEDVNTPSHPLMKQYKEMAFGKHAAKDERWGLTYCAGIGFSEPLVEGLKRVGRDLTREKLVQKMETIDGFQGIMGRITYRPFEANNPLTRLGQSEVFLTEATPDGKYKVLSDWIQTDYVGLK